MGREILKFLIAVLVILCGVSGCFFRQSNSDKVVSNVAIMQPVISRESAPTKNASQITDVNGNVGFIDEWIPPVTLDFRTGNVISPDEGCISFDKDYQFLAIYPKYCISSVYFTSVKAVSADIRIYDGYGKEVHASTQKFGYCGELENSERQKKQGGAMGFLVWNLKDKNGAYVVSGDYMWVVEFKDESGNVQQEYLNQGILFSPSPFGKSNGTPDQGCLYP